MIDTMEPTEGEFELSEQDLADLAALGETEEPKKHTLLEVWRELLSNIEAGAEQRVPPQLALRIVSSWPKLGFEDVAAYWAVYHDRLTDMRELLHLEIATDPEALNRVEDDATANAEHYMNLLLAWNQQVLLWEHEWDVNDPAAAIKLAAFADAQSFVLGQQGLVEHLTHIGFAYGEDDAAAMHEILESWAEEL